MLCVLFLVALLAGAVQAQDSTGISISVIAKGDSSWTGARLPAYPDKQPEITILKITLAPGAALPMHRHPVINAGVLLSGELTVLTEDEKTLHLKAGEGLIEVVNKWHYGKNTGNVPAVILVFYAGAVDVPITVRK
jgi:quercetin dioxygenase-like cupin family protein